MVGVLVPDAAGREDDAWLIFADDCSQRDNVGGADLEMRVAVQFDELDSCAKDGRRLFRFSNALFRRPVRAGFATRTDDKMNGTTGLRLAGDDAATGKFNVIGMRTEDKERRRFILRFQCRLHRIGQWYRDR